MRNRALIIAALVLVGLLTVAFAVRGAQHARRLRARGDEPIQPWMNVPFIARAYRVRPDIIQQALGLPSGRPDRRPLRQIAQEQGRSIDTLIADITTAIRRARSPRSPPNGTPPASSPPIRRGP